MQGILPPDRLSHRVFEYLGDDMARPIADRFRAGLKNRLVTGDFERPFEAGVMTVVIGSGEVAAGTPYRPFFLQRPINPYPIFDLGGHSRKV
jgi:hypothetical protein